MNINGSQAAALQNEAVLEELSWLARCRAGDQVALSHIIDKHRTRLIRVATNILRDQHEAEDVAQEAFIRGFRELANLRDDRAFAGYIYRIAVRICMDRLRSRRQAPAEFDSGQAAQGTRIENRVVIEKLLAQLTPDLRTTLVLREIEQLSYEEVSELMKVPVGTVRSRLHTARERFRELWLSEMKENL